MSIDFFVIADQNRWGLLMIFPFSKRQLKITGERRVILQAIEPIAKLVEYKIGEDRDGGDLTAKYIEVKPYPWLEKLQKSAKKNYPRNYQGI